MENKNILTLNRNQITELATAEIARLRKTVLDGTDKGNANKGITAMRNVCQLVASLPATATLTVEGCWGDGEIRKGQLFNAGSIAECVVKYHLTHNEDVAKEWNALAPDYKRGCVAYQIKASLSASSKATPSKAETTILVNQKGVFTLYKAEVMQYTNAQGRLPNNQAVGKPHYKLMEAMGYEM